MNWGNRIVLAFVCFIAGIFSMAYISMNTEFSLVADNYYEQELAYEDQIVRMRNANRLEAGPEFIVDRQNLKVQLRFPEQLAKQITGGKVKFYRASNARHDKEIELKLGSENTWEVDVASFVSGAWKLQLLWTDGQKEYYQEIDFVI
ncbi:FixH family protein [Roseivirga sp. UBA1976]|uniref:FixH family protein n=1 Tax=Roseivirga sp. UBA1976 TaxID=1947386 RepID=UPI00257F20C6|nr:FixH family protein [Roseivirga sp. UBA1976]MEC7754896.1 FixH family protein [Bacteroidota bacterium]|tara:strand:+ start:1063 stop:1503 length:441 start_codon:yes stop_codon:yes gene_type:complete